MANDAELRLPKRIRAREAAAELLEALPLTSYLYELAPRSSGRWSLRLAYEIQGDWRVACIDVAPEDLIAAVKDAAVRQRLLAAWRRRLAPCPNPPREAP